MIAAAPHQTNTTGSNCMVNHIDIPKRSITMKKQQIFAFVATDPSGEVCPTERRLIRRHCMKDKNKRADSRRSKREAASEELRGLATRIEDPGLGSMPLPPPSDWALFRFPEELNQKSQIQMKTYFARNPIRDLLFSFRDFGILLDFKDECHAACFKMLAHDKMCLRATQLLASACDDLVARRPLSHTSQNHLGRLLPLLNERLSNADTSSYEALLYVVGILASIAVHFRDHSAVKMHSAGILNIVRRQGKLHDQNLQSLLPFHVERLNFSSMLVDSSWISIHDLTAWPEPVFPEEIMKRYDSNTMVSADGLIDGDLAKLFKTLQLTTILFNSSFYNATSIDIDLFQNSLGFVQYSLAKLRGIVVGLSKVLYLAMSGFLATTFRLPDMIDHPCCGQVAKQLHVAYRTWVAESQDANLPDTIRIWIVFVCLICSEEAPGPDLGRSWERISKRHSSWSEIRQHLKRVMWIDTFHDKYGRRAYERMVN